MRVLVWNVFWRAGDFAARARRIRGLLERWRPDVALLTECPWPDDALLGAEWRWEYAPTERIGDQPVGLCVAARSRLVASAPGRWPLVLLEDGTAVAAAHLPWRGGDAAGRRDELEALAGHSFLTGASACLIGGDFNCLPGSDELGGLGRRGFVDCWASARERRGPEDTRPRDRWARACEAHGFRAPHAPQVFGRIDQLWTRGLAPKSAEVVPEGEDDGAPVSDHRPLIVELAS
ncbi:MAG TPA: endonuclease/exonuclease/phosphatase family protein [Kofleriaceae bacterium]|nr:endonuclease/exonuclease/phosphatase family protein [Kofleriaceae bacterium]